MEEKHFFAVHTFVSDEVRSQFVTPPEKRNPPEKRETEKEWVEKIHGKYARCVQTWVGNEEFFYCHWIAKSEQDVYRQLDQFNLGADRLNTMVHEVHEFLSAYRNSDKLRTYPEEGLYW